MHATRLIFDALPPAEREPLPAVPVDGLCCLTGEPGPCVPRAELFGKSFTEQNLLRAPDSPLVGVPAWVALKYRWERFSSWHCNGESFGRLTRRDVRALIVSAPLFPWRPWAGYITTSYKKHGALRAPVNPDHDHRVWLFEMVTVDCSDQAKVMSWWQIMTDAQREGIGRQSMASLEMSPALIRKIGIARWETFRGWARDKYKSGLYQLLCYLLPSQEELKMGGVTDE